jgi:sigma-B regulation protein RsbU (phosphoserine phosphatase)
VEIDPFISYLFDLGNILLPFLIPMIIYILFLEKRVLNPIKKFSEFLSADIEDYDDIEKLKKNLNTITVNNEIKILSDSLIKMEGDLISYSENLVKVTSEKEKYETELKLAREIQYSMIPTDFEEFCENENFSVWGMMKAAHEMGGDFYDYFKIDDENIGFVIGDVSGKGITAALIMAKAMTLIQDYVTHYKDLSKAVYDVNNKLCEGNEEYLFVTSWLGKLNIKTGKLTFINAGHNPPLIKQNNGNFEYLKTEPELVLACMEEMPYKTETIQMNPGDALFLYTDGVTEANDDYNGFYGDERLQNILNKHKDDDLKTIIE